MMEFPRTENAAGLGGAAAAAWLRDAQAWTGLQCELLSGIEALWTECARRQSEAIEASARTMQSLLDGRHYVEIGQLQRDWLASAARRTADAAGRWAADGAVQTREASAVSASGVEAANDAVPPPRDFEDRAPHERKEPEREAA